MEDLSEIQNSAMAIVECIPGQNETKIKTKISILTNNEDEFQTLLKVLNITNQNDIDTIASVNVGIEISDENIQKMKFENINDEVKEELSRQTIKNINRYANSINNDKNTTRTIMIVNIE